MKMMKILLLILVNCAILIGLLVAVEGLSSWVLFLKAVYEQRGEQLAEGRYARYDPELGWTNIANKVIPDMFGPGKGLTINAQSFRGSREYPVPVPQNKVRIICSGDSYTFGFGVADDKTWCALLETRDSRIESINLGVGSYGLDQSYLRYLRDGRKFDTDVLLFAFIWIDFDRMIGDEVVGYGKPVLTIENGRLKVLNTPVPKSLYLGTLLNRHRNAIDRLKVRQLMADMTLKHKYDGVIFASAEDLALQIFSDLRSVSREKGAELVLVYLPDERDITGMHDTLRSGLRKMCSANGFHLIDLTEDAVRHYGAAYRKMFIQEGEMPQYESAAGHYSEEGNRFVAEALSRRIASLPGIARKLPAMPRR